MKSTSRRHPATAFSQCCTIGVLAMLSFAAHAEPPGIAPEAKQILKASTDFVASQQRFSTSTRNTLDVVLKSGQKIEFNSTGRQSVQRPDKLRAERTGDIVNQVFVYDGRSLTMYNPEEKVFSQAAAPARSRACSISRARSSTSSRRPATSSTRTPRKPDGGSHRGQGAGQGGDRGSALRPLAFRAPQLDWQIWIQEGPQPCRANW